MKTETRKGSGRGKKKQREEGSQFREESVQILESGEISVEVARILRISNFLILRLPYF